MVVLLMKEALMGFFSGYDSKRPERLEWEECN